MQRLSQRDLIGEGFGTNLLKMAARGVAKTASGTAKMISPTAHGLAKTAADKVGGAIQSVVSGPKTAIMDYFNRPEVKSRYDRVKVTREREGGNKFSRELEISLRDVKNDKMETATVIARRDDGGGLTEETWNFDRIILSNGDQIQIPSDTRTDQQKIDDSNASIDRMKGSLDELPKKGDPHPGEEVKFEIGDKVNWRTAVRRNSRGELKGDDLRVGEIAGFNSEGVPMVKTERGLQAVSASKLKKTVDGKPINEKSQKSLLKHLQSLSR